LGWNSKRRPGEDFITARRQSFNLFTFHQVRNEHAGAGCQSERRAVNFEERNLKRKSTMRSVGTEVSSWGRVLPISLGIGLVSFLATEFMHRWLVPDIGRNRERWLAEAFSAFLVTCLVAKLVHMAREQQRRTVARMQVIAEMNHHIRNALAPIALSVDAIENQQLIRIISDGVDRIDWALREILPREKPFLKQERYKPSPFGAAPHKSREVVKNS
jgi:signal transduction histidine kinase